MPYAREVALARQLVFVCPCGLARRDFGIIPQKFQHRQHPVLRKEPAFAQKPRAVWVLESVHRIAQQSRVPRIENRVFVVTLSRGCAVREQLVQVGISNVAENWKLMGWINSRGGPLKFRQQNQRS